MIFCNWKLTAKIHYAIVNLFGGLMEPSFCLDGKIIAAPDLCTSFLNSLIAYSVGIGYAYTGGEPNGERRSKGF